MSAEDAAVDYKRSRIKQYHKEGRALRTETTIHDTRDFGVGKRLKNLLREIARRSIGATSSRSSRLSAGTKGVRRSFWASTERHLPASLRGMVRGNRPAAGARVAGAEHPGRPAAAIAAGCPTPFLRPHRSKPFSFRTCLWGESSPLVRHRTPSNSAPLQLARRVHQRSLMRQAAESRVAGAFLLLVLLTSRGSTGDPAAADDHGPGPASTLLAVSVSETPDAVLLHIGAPGDVEPGSVEVQFAGRKTVVLARDVMGRPMRSQPLRLPEPVVEEGASADYDGDGVLVMTLRKQATAQEMAHIMPAGTSGGSPR